MEKKIKSIEELSIATDPDKICIGLNTTVQDLVDVINQMRVELLIKDSMIAALKHLAETPPDNVISIKQEDE